MIAEMGDYAWSEHIVTVFLACQITIKNVQVQLSQKQLYPKCGFHDMKCFAFGVDYSHMETGPLV
jgi:hypothetical protein